MTTLAEVPNIGDMSLRAAKITSVGNSKEVAGQRISAEFNASAYVRKGVLWVSYKDLTGKQAFRAIW